MKVVKNVALTLYAIVVFIPVVTIILSTFKTIKEIYENTLALPKHFHFDNYMTIFQDQSMGLYLRNSVTVTLCSVILTVFFASLIAFSIVRAKKLTGAVVFSFFTLGMAVPAQVNMIPLYNLISQLKLTNSLVGLILINISVTLPVAVFILTGFMRGVPKTLFEASHLDGANQWQSFSKVAIPLSLPALASTAIFLFVMHWNDLLYPLLLITNDQYKTLPLALLQFQGEYMTNYPMLFTGVMIASAPMVIAYLFLQKYFIKGMTAGAMKG